MTITLNHLQTHETITSMEAFHKYGITRLSAVIFELRKVYNIATIMTDGTNRYGRPTHFATYKYIGKVDE